MPTVATDIHRANLQNLLERRGGLDHLHVRKHGASLVLYTLDGDDRVSRARFTAISRMRWRLDMPLHTGRWEQTPYEGSLSGLLELLISDFAPWIAPLV